MNQQRRTILSVMLVLAGIMQCYVARAQGGSNVIRWTGNDYNAVATAAGTEVFLYNVGTGRFLIHGGDWGVQGRLFYEDTGKLMKIQSVSEGIIFDTGIITSTKGGANVSSRLCCNVPSSEVDGDNWIDYNTDGSINGNSYRKTFTIIMDGKNNNWNTWFFERVPTNDGTYTYYMYQKIAPSGGNKTNHYMGAVYGTNGPLESGLEAGHDGDPVGRLVGLSSSFDKAVWTTIAPTSETKDDITGNSMSTMVPIFNADTKIELRKLYQWRIVTKEQLMASLQSGDVDDGLSTNLTYLVTDRGIERNDYNFFDDWNVSTFSDNPIPANSDGIRYKYTWGQTGYSVAGDGKYSPIQHQADPRYVNENWYNPIRLKAQYGTEPKLNAKYGFMEFEGVGMVSTAVKEVAPETGYYKISAYGFYSGDHPGYLFATTSTPSTLSSTQFSGDGYSNGTGTSCTFSCAAFEKATKSPMLNADKEQEGSVVKQSDGTYALSGVMGAGYDFVFNKTPYYREVEIYVQEGQTIYIGVAKTNATRSARDYIRNGNSYYHDTDWVGADQFMLTYLGDEEPVLFDEDKEVTFTDDSYLGRHNYEHARAVRLHRTFQKNMWNSFVFPLDLTAVQVRSGFGDATQVAELVGIGKESGDANVIDFMSVQLPAEGKAITKGKFYLIKPVNDPTKPVGGIEYYSLGSQKLNTEDLITDVVEDQYDPIAGTENAEGHNSIMVKGTFFSSIGYDRDSGNKNPDTSGPYVPAGSYVMSNDRVYHTQSDLKTKGFRAWIVDVEDSPAKTYNYRIAFNGVVDENGSTEIEQVVNEKMGQRQAGGGVYDLSGRKVADAITSHDSLPKGLYIVNGKKFVVK